MKEWLSSILQRIANGSLLPAGYFAHLDCDAALQSRDEDEAFERSWIQLSKEITRRWSALTVADDVWSLAEDVRRESFLTVSRATRQHEIASYVSDDFELIVRSRIAGLDDPFLDRLWDEYDRGRFPRP
jgi:hypothetical protein